MKWARNHIILKTKNFEYNIRGNEKFVKLVGVKITFQTKGKSKKSRTVQPGFSGVLCRNILEFLNGSTFL